jgi:ABC-2 type transport system ATP-binding protein
MDDAIIKVEGLVKVFGAKVPVRALDGLNLTVERGGVYGLLGPNGAGKTTLIRVLTTLLPADAGSARVAGVDVRQHPEQVRARIGLAGQYAAVDDHLTGRENVEMVGRLYGLPRRQARRRAGEVLERIGLTEAADRQVKTYSGGMRRRLDLAACLVGRPQVLFLDEPTAGLDPASRRDLWALIGDLMDTGTTVLLTTQYLEEADQLTDRIAVIDHGRLVSEGTSDQLKDRVGGAVLELTVPDGHRARALWALRTMQAEDPTDDQHRGRIVLPAPDGARTLSQALRRLDAAGVTPEDLALRKPTLDDVFLALTGHLATTPTGNSPEPSGSADRHGQQQRERAAR